MDLTRCVHIPGDKHRRCITDTHGARGLEERKGEEDGEQEKEIGSRE